MAIYRFPSPKEEWEKIVIKVQNWLSPLKKWTKQRIQYIIFSIFFILTAGYCLFLKHFFAPVARWFIGEKNERVKLSYRSIDFKRVEKYGYKFRKNFLTLPDNAGLGEELDMHYIDEGPDSATETVLLLHGQSTWSFMYRRVIPYLAKKKFRVIAPDFIGSGMSDKLTSVDNYSFGFHVDCVKQLIDHLNLKSITLVGEEWGALVGIHVASLTPENFSRFVFLNAGVPTGKIFGYDLGDHRDSSQNPAESLTNCLIRLNWKVFAELLGKYTLPRYSFIGENQDIHHNIFDIYDAPFPEVKYRASLYSWSKMYPFLQNHENYNTMIKLRDFLKTWDKPALIFLTDRDKLVTDCGKMMIKLIPTTKLAHVYEGGIFVPENQGEKFAERIFKFMSGLHLVDEK